MPEQRKYPGLPRHRRPAWLSMMNHPPRTPLCVTLGLLPPTAVPLWHYLKCGNGEVYRKKVNIRYRPLLYMTISSQHTTAGSSSFFFCDCCRASLHIPHLHFGFSLYSGGEISYFFIGFTEKHGSSRRPGAEAHVFQTAFSPLGNWWCQVMFFGGCPYCGRYSCCDT